MSSTSVIAIARLIDIFEVFRSAQRPLSLTELAEGAGIPKSTCHAMVSTLIERGYLYTLSRPRALYPTRRLYDVAGDVCAKDPFIERAAPALERLRDTTGETVIFGKRQGDHVVYLQVIDGLHAIRYTARAGEFKPLHSSSVGKALLGSLKETELHAWVEHQDLPAITPKTLTDRAALLQDIKEGRKRGYFTTRGENVSDVWAVASFVSAQRETLAVAVAGPQHRIESCLVEAARPLVATCGFLARQWRAEVDVSVRNCGNAMAG